MVRVWDVSMVQGLGLDLRVGHCERQMSGALSASP